MKITESFKGISSFAVAAILLVVTASFTFANFDNNERSRSAYRETMQAHREAMTEIMESGDYNAWASAVPENGRREDILKIINEDNFPRFVEAWKLKREAHEKIQEAHEIMEELGFDRMHKGRSGKRGHGTMRLNKNTTE